MNELLINPQDSVRFYPLCELRDAYYLYHHGKKVKYGGRYDYLPKASDKYAIFLPIYILSNSNQKLNNTYGYCDIRWGMFESLKLYEKIENNRVIITRLGGNKNTRYFTSLIIENKEFNISECAKIIEYLENRYSKEYTLEECLITQGE